MKFGMRKPSLKKSFKARTTSKYKRAFKRSVNPFYGKKGIGFIKMECLELSWIKIKKTKPGVSI